MKKNIVRAIVISMLLGIFPFSLFSQQAKFTLNPITDSLIPAIGMGFLVSSLMIPPPIPSYSGLPLNLSDVNAFDRFAARPYSKLLDISGDVLMFASIAIPAVLFSAPKSEWPVIGVMYAESVLFTFAFTDFVKNLVARERPYMYFDSPPEKSISDGDFARSFFSRHTALAFNGAAFATFVFSEYYPKSVWKIPIISVAYVFATATAAVRVASGSHFLSDVIVGAVLGTVSGLGIPLLHKTDLFNKRTLRGDTSLQIQALPTGFMCTLRF